MLHIDKGSRTVNGVTLLLRLTTWTTQMQSSSTQTFKPESMLVNGENFKKEQQSIRHLRIKEVSLLRSVNHPATNITRKTIQN